MKKILYLMSAAALLFFASACEKKIDRGGFTPETPKMEFLSEAMDTVVADGGSFTVRLKSNLPWRAKSTFDWISVDELTCSGLASDSAKVNFTVAKNKVTEPRSGYLTFWITDDYVQQYKVEQYAGKIVIIKKCIYVKSGASGTGASWTAATSLDAALKMEYNEGDTIKIAAGTYKPGNTVTGGVEGNDAYKTFEFKDNINIIGGYPASATAASKPDAKANPVILDGDEKSNHVVTVTAPASENGCVFASGLVIKNGLASNTTKTTVGSVQYSNTFGGGVIVGPSKIILENCTIMNNKSTGSAGGFYAFSTADVTLNNCTLQANQCTATSSNGGALEFDSGSKLVMNGGSIVGNIAGAFCGGPYIYKGKAWFYNVTITGNNSGGANAATNGKYYGGFYLREGYTMFVNCTIADNTATGAGAGIGVYGTASSQATLDIINCTVSGNNIKGTKTGAGMFVNCGQDAATINVYNTVIAGNTIGGTTISEVDGNYKGTYSKCVVGVDAYNDKGTVASSTFDYKTMLSKTSDSGLTVYKLAGSANPAMTLGYSESELKTLATRFSPAVDEVVITGDILGNSRASKTYMGSYVK